MQLKKILFCSSLVEDTTKAIENAEHGEPPEVTAPGGSFWAGYHKPSQQKKRCARSNAPLFLYRSKS